MHFTRHLALALALAGCAGVSAKHGAAAPRGKLVVVGGGGTPEDVIARTIALAGGPDARAVVLAQASSRPEAGEESAAFWRGKGLTRVANLDLADREAARKAIESADLVWFPGGDQVRLLDAIEAAGVAAAIRARYAAGAVVGGTSAGAAVMSSTMILGGETADLTAVRSGSVATKDGLGLLPGSIVDQHFLKRQRFNRLLSAVLDHPDLVGIGIDERTAIVVDGSRLEVLGESAVLVLDARGGSGDVRLRVLRSGAELDLAPRLAFRSGDLEDRRPLPPE